jgi:hypothetical protein
MSIHDEINARVGEAPPRLFRLIRSLESDPESRTMFMSKEIQSLLDGPWISPDLQYRAGRLKGDLEEFIKGSTLTLCFEPFAAKTAYMGRLSPIGDSIWDIRSRDPRPSLRVVGLFADADVFIALRWSPRSRLGPRDSREWRDIVTQCKTDWTSLFSTYEPVKGDDLHAFFSEPDSIHVV